MKSLSKFRLPLFVIAGVFVLASCGSDEQSVAASPTAVPTQAPVEEATPEEPTSIPLTDLRSTEPDDRTEQEIAVDRLDLMMVQFGIEELDDFENGERCVVERLESENIEFTGEGTAELIALAACNDTIISAWLPPTNPALPDETWACTVESIGGWISELSIADAEAFFGTATPPQEFIELTADRCNASTDEIAAAF